MMRYWIPIALALVLGGCATTARLVDTAKVTGAGISDRALQNAVWWTCDGSSIGAVKRRYGHTQERADIYQKFCVGDGSANVVAPPIGD